ncbi:MAG: spore coat U domain-containing protein [Hyphomonadaceae bacterium]|nr:spore coat U domain-containing protein [Hyphomonadaceae bacterium]
MMLLVRALGLTAFVWLAMAGSASASCVGVKCSCSVSGNPLSFGTYVPTASGNIQVAADISVTCKAFVLGLISYEIHLGPGVHGSVSARKLSNSGSLLSYNIYTNTGRTIIWGDGTGGTGVKGDSYLLALGASRTETVSMYGKLLAGQNVSAGSYSDTIVATVVY